jgi:fucose 4-O-acetylase-like acetyltransferase
LLALLDRLVAVGYVLIAQFRLAPPTTPASDYDIRALLCFEEPGVTGGLLFLYALLLVATPLLDAAWRRFGGVVLVAASLGVFALAHATDGGVAHWPFPVLYWQPLFVIGYALSRPLARWHESGGRVSAPWLLMSTAAFAFVFLVRNPAALGLPLSMPLGNHAFVKVPLSPSEMVWYLAASGFLFTWSAWLSNRLAGQRWSRDWLCRLGRQSLLVYVAHLFIEPPILELVTLVDPSPLVRVALLPLAIVLLVTVAVASERVKQAHWTAPVPLVAPRWAPIGGLMGSTVAAGAVGVVMTLQVVIGPPANWTYSPLAGPLSQEALPADEALLVTTEESTAEESAPLVESLDGGEPDLFHPDQEAAPATET